MLEETFGSIRQLKLHAHALRNRERFDDALAKLDEALEVFSDSERKREPEEVAPADVRAELADTIGLKGGIYRRLGAAEKALREYERGLEIEKIDRLSTYNLVNTIFLSLELGKILLSEDLTKERIRGAIDQLRRDVAGHRSDEWWAWSDLAQLQLILGDVDDSSESYRRAMRTGPSAREIDRHILIFESLAASLRHNSPEAADRISTAARNLQSQVH